jgi:uncharacterized protein
MATFTSHEPGTFNWVELATSDAASARGFYTALFGWDVVEMKGDWGSYFIFRNKDLDCAAMYASDNAPRPSWLSYINVTNADETVTKAASLGAKIVSPSSDVADYGRMAVLEDPQGGGFAIWQAKSGIGVHVRDEVNSLCWNELHARDLERAKAFYPAMFGWRMKESPDYIEWHHGEHAIGGMLQAHGNDSPSAWIPYFSVADCDATAAAAEANGGTVFVAPRDIEHVGRFAVIGDAQGAIFSIIRLAS